MGGVKPGGRGLADPSTAVPILEPGSAAEGGQRQPSLAGRFSDGPRPALSTEIMDSSGDISRPGT